MKNHVKSLETLVKTTTDPPIVSSTLCMILAKSPTDQKSRLTKHHRAPIGEI